MTTSTTRRAPVRALVIPAALVEPIREVELERRGDSCLDALQALVGGMIETLPHPTRDDVAPYLNEEGKLLELPPNWRATELLRESIQRGDYIAGDCVFTGFDAQRGETIDLPADFEPDLPKPIELDEPSAVERRDRSISHEWVLHDDGDGKRTLAVLRISHHRAGVNYLSGRQHPNEFTATLANETEERAFGGVMRGFRLGDGITIEREEVTRFSAKRMDAFAERALAWLRALCSAGDPRVLRYFARPNTAEAAETANTAIAAPSQ